MKYIRTKDGIYELDCSLEIRDNFLIKKGYYYCIDDYCEDESLGEIKAQAYTIEELCDEFVLYDNQLNTNGVFDKKVITFKWIKGHLEIYKGMTIYGAIWTNKGLIYVAKLNEKGDWELI